MRKDRVKLARLIRYLQVKDLKSKLVSAQTDKAEEIEDDLTSICKETLGGEPKAHQTKRVKLCYDFLSSIDQTGCLLEMFEDDQKNFFDEIKHERDLVRFFCSFKALKADKT